MHDPALDLIALDGSPQPAEHLGGCGQDGSRGLRLEQKEPPIARRYQEIDLQALLVAKVVEIAGLSASELELDDLGSDEALEDRAQKRGTIQSAR